jgi:hypothetical protein
MIRIWIGIVLLLSLFLSIAQCQAQDTLLIGVGSIHIQDGKFNPNHYNQFNPGLGIGVGHWSVGAFYNSERRFSVLGTYTPFSGWLLPWGGVVTGYKRYPIAPAIGLSIVPWKNSGPILSFTPIDLNGGFVTCLLWRQKL